jgi:hypothetical protein
MSKKAETKTAAKLKDGHQCRVVAGTHADKSATVRILIPAKPAKLPLRLYKKMQTDLRLWGRM